MTKRVLPFIVALLPAVGCTTPTAGKPKQEAGAESDPAEQARIQKIWKGTTVGVGIGEAHNLVPAETEMVKAAVEMQKGKIKKCFEQPVLRRGCRTGGIPSQFDAMLMILSDGSIRDTRIVPNKNDLPKECYDAVSCTQDVLNQTQVQGLQRFEGARQVYMTVTVKTPDETMLDVVDGGQ
jgi:hypothetical protein